MPRRASARAKPHTVKDRLERAILDGTWKAGERLPAERDLAARWRVSRATVREAMAQLAARGILTRRQGDGTYLSDPALRDSTALWADLAEHRDDLQGHLLEFRDILESHTAALAAIRHQAADRRRLLHAANRVDRAFASQDRTAQIEADAAFHLAIAEAARNPVFSRLLASLRTTFHHHMRHSLAGTGTDPAHAGAVRAQHAAITRAILGRNPDGAREAIRAHLDFVRIHFNQLAPRPGSAPADRG